MTNMHIASTPLFMSASRVLMASDTDIIIGSVDPDFKIEGDKTETPHTYIHREDAVPRGKKSVITVGGDATNSAPRSLSLDIQDVMQGEDLSIYPTAYRVAKVRNKAISLYCDTLARHAEICEIHQPGMEHWLFNGIFNVISHFTGILTTYLGRGFADFKRSELTEYMQSNRFSAYQIFRASPGEIGDIQLPLPKEIACRNIYEAYLDIKPFLTQVRMSDRVGTLISIIENIIHDRGVVANMPYLQGNDIKSAAKQALSRMRRNTKQTADFLTMYGNGRGMEQVIDELRDADAFLYEVSGIHSKVKKLDEKLVELSRFSIPPDSAKHIAALLKDFADILSSYGDAITILNILQHHAVVHLTILREFLNA